MTRYTLHLTGLAGAKARLRTALKLMGFDGIRIEEREEQPGEAKVDPKTCPTSPVALLIADLYSRPHDRPWAEAEISEFRKAVKRGVLTEENMIIIATYYKSERKKPDHCCRRDVLRFIRYFDGELDRARAAKPQDRKLEWPQNVVKLPVVDEAEAERIRLLAKQQAQAYRNEARP